MDNRKFQSAASATPPTAPASPSSGYPTNGNPGTGTPATLPGEFWFHKIGEELRAVITGAGITNSDADLAQLLAAIKYHAINEQKLTHQIFTTGSATYTPTAGTNKVLVEVIGGGGAGGGAPATSSVQFSVGGGGGSGAYAKKLITSAFSGVTVTVGAGGTANSGASG